MSKKNGRRIYFPRREAEDPQPEKSADGSCLRSNMKKSQKGGQGHESNPF